MKTNGRDKSLESYKVFPYVAWGLTLIFTFFVYNITVDLKDVASDLKEQSKRLQQQVDTPAGELTDFSN